MSVSGTGKKDASQPKEEGMMDKMGGMLRSVIGFPDRIADRFEHPVAKKIVYIVADLLFIGLGVGIFFMLIQFNLQSLLDPGIQSMMGTAAAIMAVGVGVSWLVKDMIPKSWHRTMSKIAGWVAAAAVTAGAACFIASAFHNCGLINSSIGPYYFAGLLLLPTAVYFAANAAENMMQKEIEFYKRHEDMPVSRNAFNDQMQRLAENRAGHVELQNLANHSNSDIESI